MARQDHTARTLTVGLSGPSSSGKTTLARLLSRIFDVDASAVSGGRSAKLFIFHQDDTFKPDTEFVLTSFTSDLFPLFFWGGGWGVVLCYIYLFS
jgi:nicotinamide/nicotinate riboside kinase